MEKTVSIQEFPVFERGVFKRNPALFDAYHRNIPDHQRQKYERARRSLHRYEETVTWQVIRGPGFCGATHPGAGKIFNGVMTGDMHPVYNSDCLYVNPTRRVFAVSDPPGVTTFSRGLMTELDSLLQDDLGLDLEEAVNKVNREAGSGLRDRATLALVHLPYDDLGRCGGSAQVLVAGDTALFRGNLREKSLERLSAYASRWGTPNVYFDMQAIDVHEEDFFIIASDGIVAVRAGESEMSIDEALLDVAATNFDGFAFEIARRCNDIVQEQTIDRVRTAFASGDDISLILIDPSRLQPTASSESYILGGYVA